MPSTTFFAISFHNPHIKRCEITQSSSSRDAPVCEYIFYDLVIGPNIRGSFINLNDNSCCYAPPKRAHIVDISCTHTSFKFIPNNKSLTQFAGFHSGMCLLQGAFLSVIVCMGNFIQCILCMNFVRDKWNLVYRTRTFSCAHFTGSCLDLIENEDINHFVFMG